MNHSQIRLTLKNNFRRRQNTGTAPKKNDASLHVPTRIPDLALYSSNATRALVLIEYQSFSLSVSLSKTDAGQWTNISYVEPDFFLRAGAPFDSPKRGSQMGPGAWDLWGTVYYKLSLFTILIDIKNDLSEKLFFYIKKYFLFRI